MAVVCSSCGTSNPDGAKFCAECAAPLADAIASRPRETRRTVTLLFADVSGSTAFGERLDPESLRGVMNRYFALMQQAVVAHGGTVEKFVGDAVMSVFGLPQLHEDDALRAVRAAGQAREALTELNEELERSLGLTLSVRMGLNTGEVMAGDAGAGQGFVTGDAVNTAARLEQAAPSGEILLGASTYQLVRDAVEVAAIEPLVAKGKAEPLPAYRLLGITPGAVGRLRQLDAPMVGRERELARLRATFADAVAERSCQMFTVLGPAGVGKSRLVAEFLAGAQATILRGRCLPYGEGITYWPLGEALRAGAGIDDEDDRETARAKLATLADDMPEAGRAVAAVAQAIGLETGSAPQEEIFWAVRKLFEAIARRTPLIVEFDDIQWAEGAFLDLIEHLADWSRDAPILLLCPARPELLDLRPQWGGGKFNARTVLLEPLPPDLSGTLVEHLLDGRSLPAALLTRIADAAEGNPLFLEEMVGMLRDQGTLGESGGLSEFEAQTLPIPPTISALLAARLDRLPAEERAVAERAAVVGRIFERGAVAELSAEADRPQVGARLLSLVRKELVRPDGSGLAGEDAYRFRHLLIRDAAYDALPKAERADLHERFGSWLERVTGDRLDEYEEIIGYHLEQAHDYRRQLGTLDAATMALAERAARRLVSAGMRVLNTSDAGAAVKLLERALTLQPVATGGRAEILIALGEALLSAGRLTEAQVFAEEALEWARAAGERTIEAMALVALAEVNLMVDPGELSNKGAEVAQAAMVLEEAGRHREAAKANRLLGVLHGDGGRYDEAIRFMDVAVAQASLSHDRHQLARSLATRALQMTVGPQPATTVIEAIEPLVLEVGASGSARGVVLLNLVEAYGLVSRFEEARAAAALSRSIAIDMGQPIEAAGTSLASGPMERLAGNLEAAETELRADYETLKGFAEHRYSSTVAGFLAHVLCDRGAMGEALTLTNEAEHLSAEDDYLSQVLWRSARGRALAASDPDAAMSLARDAVARVAATDFLVDHGNALLSLAEVHEVAGRREDAVAAIDAAVALFEAKGATAYVHRAEGLRSRLSLDPPMHEA